MSPMETVNIPSAEAGKGVSGLLVLVRQFNKVDDSIRDKVFLDVMDGKITGMDGVMGGLRNETLSSLEGEVEGWYEGVAGVSSYEKSTNIGCRKLDIRRA